MQFHEVVVIGVAFRVERRLAVAIDAPAHGQSRILVHDFHILDRTVTSLALNSTYLGVLRVVEVSEVGQVVYTYPLDRLLAFDSPVNLLDFWRLCLNLRVAVHTDVSRGNVS